MATRRGGEAMLETPPRIPNSGAEEGEPRWQRSQKMGAKVV